MFHQVNGIEMTRLNARGSPQFTRYGMCRLAPVLLSAIILLAAGCTVPEHMEVRAGVDPRNVDDGVRFRTTYYFRVFDVCQSRSAAGTKDIIIPQTDSLYRFRMTGKAFALFTNVHFEAGTLKSYEIDPFGANVVFDEKSNRFRFKSRRQTEQEAAREDKYRELQRLLKIFENHENLPLTSRAKLNELIDLQLDLLAEKPLTGRPLLVPFTAEEKLGDIKKLAEKYEKATTTGSKATEEDKNNIIDAVKRALAQLEKAVTWEVAKERAVEGEAKARTAWGIQNQKVAKLMVDPFVKKDPIGKLVDDTHNRLEMARFTSATADTAAPRAIGNGAKDRPPICSAGHVARRGFQILGPEGWRTFDQDERLILAMSSSGEPLISMLREISSRVLAEQPDRAALLLPLVKERLRISRTLRTIDRLESKVTEKKAEQAVEDILKVFKEEN